MDIKEEKLEAVNNVEYDWWGEKRLKIDWKEILKFKWILLEIILYNKYGSNPSELLKTMSDIRKIKNEEFNNERLAA